MARHVWFSGIVLFAFAAWSWAEDKKEEKAPAKNARLERMKTLAGEWVAADEKGKPTDKLITSFKVTGGGSAVRETIHPGQAMEMVTMYHMDGKDLVLTHYCALQNQPHMKLDAKSTTDKFLFKFAGGSNIDPAKDMHIHEGSIAFIDDDHIEWSWQAYDDGKPSDGHKISMKLVRKR
jgi:hypothetical protein